jgi:hypothetical protein
MLEIFQSRLGGRPRANSLQKIAIPRPAPAGEFGAADAVCGFTLKLNNKGNWDLVGTNSQ